MLGLLNALATPPPPGWVPGLPNVGVQASPVAALTPLPGPTALPAPSVWLEAWAWAVLVILAAAVLAAAFLTVWFAAHLVAAFVRTLWRALRPPRRAVRHGAYGSPEFLPPPAVSSPRGRWRR